MHATTSAIVGISLGRLRRSRGTQRIVLVVAGFLIAMLFHMIFNNAVAALQGRGAILLLVGFGIGVGGAAIIAYQITQALKEEKKHFERVLTVGASGVTRNEVRAIQSMGDDALEATLSELGDIFGKNTLPPIRRLFALQANIGILRNNLSNPCSDRLRSAWETEIVAARREMDDIRKKQLGVNVMLYLRNVFPSEDAQGDYARTFVERVADNDPTHVHRFDLFIVGSERAGTIPPDELERIAVTLQQAEFFRDLALGDLENLSRAAVSREFAAGATLFRQGDQGDEMFQIQSGEIEIVVPQGNTDKLINVRRAGEIIGELALLDGYPRSATARARGSVKALTIRRDSFLAFLRSRPQVMLAILTFLSRSVRYTTEIIETSVLWATHIARGDYAGAQKLGYTGDMPLTSPAAHAPDSATSAVTATQTTAALQMQFEGVSAASPALLRGMFAKATQALEERDSAGKLTGVLKSADNKTAPTGKHKINLFASGKTPPEQAGTDA
jgi:CRP-like cAMP-binding protein